MYTYPSWQLQFQLWHRHVLSAGLLEATWKWAGGHQSPNHGPASPFPSEALPSSHLIPQGPAPTTPLPPEALPSAYSSPPPSLALKANKKWEGVAIPALKRDGARASWLPLFWCLCLSILAAQVPWSFNRTSDLNAKSLRCLNTLEDLDLTPIHQ